MLQNPFASSFALHFSMISVASLTLSESGMLCYKSLHKTHRLGGICLIQLYFGRLFTKTKCTHIIHFFGSSDYSEMLQQIL